MELGGARRVLNVLVEDGFEGEGKYESMELGCGARRVEEEELLGM